MKNEIRDRSQIGNKSCFRNERHNNVTFKWTPEWSLPSIGTFECDFLYLVRNRPLALDQVSEGDFKQLKAWFQQYSGDQKKKDSKLEVDEGAMADAFKSVSEFFTFSTDQLLELLNVFPGPEWRFKVYITGIARVHDYRNYDFIKH